MVKIQLIVALVFGVILLLSIPNGFYSINIKSNEKFQRDVNNIATEETPENFVDIMTPPEICPAFGCRKFFQHFN